MPAKMETTPLYASPLNGGKYAHGWLLHLERSQSGGSLRSELRGKLL